MDSFKWKDIKIVGFLVSLIIMFVLSLSTLNKTIKPVVTEYGKNKSIEIANLIINNSILEIIGEINKPYIIVNENNEGKITSFSYNNSLLNKISTDINMKINKNIKLVQEGKLESLNIINDIIDYKVKDEALYYQVPLFIGSSNFILSSLGPNIPLKFQLIGNTTTELLSSINSYGINNVLVEIKIKTKLNMKVLLPFSKENNQIENTTIIASLAIQGEIPNYYLGSGSINNITGNIPVS